MGGDGVHDLVTLKEYVDSRFESVKETLAATDKAMSIRLEAMNELRSQIASERGLYILRTEHESQHKALDADIRSLRESRAEIAGKASISAFYFSIGAAMVSLLLSAASLIKVIVDK